jgi:hypothetical protein
MTVRCGIGFGGFPMMTVLPAIRVFFAARISRFRVSFGVVVCTLRIIGVDRRRLE